MSPEEKAREIDAALDAKARKDAEEKEREEEKKEETRKMDAEMARRSTRSFLVLILSASAWTQWKSGWADAAKKDGEMKGKGDPEPLKADSRFDSAEARNELSEIQTNTERASAAWSKSAPHPWDHESPDAYRRRAAQFHKQHSSRWKEVDLRELSGRALKNATAQIFNYSYAMASSDEPYARRVNRDTGHVIKEYYGSPMAWMS